jgi:hypothetical protein
VGLIIEIKTIADQLVEFDLGRSIKTALAATIPTPIAAGTGAAIAAVATTTPTRTSAAISAATAAGGTSALTWRASFTRSGATFARWAIFAINLLCSLFFSHVFLILCQPGPFERYQAFRPQF